MSEWISTGEACRMLGFYLSAPTFRDKYRGIIPYVLTPGGHYRWHRASLEAIACLLYTSDAADE